MKEALKFAVPTAGIAILLKLLLFNVINDEQDARFYSVMGYLFLMLLACVLNMFALKNRDQFAISFVDFFKAGLRASSIYALVIALFAYTYYGHINTNYFEEKIRERIELAQNFDFKAMLEEGHPLMSQTQEEFIAKEQKMAETIYDPYTYAGGTLITLMIAGAGYAVFMGFFFYRFKPRV